MKRIATKTTYLQMLAPPAVSPGSPRRDVTVEHLAAPSVEEYRRLYRGVGRDFHWVDRLRMPDDQLRAILQHERVEVHCLKVAGAAAGYAELDRRAEGEVELAYFGLFPAFIGQGLGKYFLAWAVAKAWSSEPRRLWVHTCDLDHAAALPTYIKAGFIAYHVEMIDQIVE